MYSVYMLHICKMLLTLVRRPRPQNFRVTLPISFANLVFWAWRGARSWWFLHSQLNQRRVLPLRNPIALWFWHLMPGKVENQATQILMDALLCGQMSQMHRSAICTWIVECQTQYIHSNDENVATLHLLTGASFTMLTPRCWSNLGASSPETMKTWTKSVQLVRFHWIWEIKECQRMSRVVSFGLRSKNIPKLRNPISEACAALSLVLSPWNLWDLCPAMDAGLAPVGHSQFGELCFCRFLLYPSVLSKKLHLQMCTWSSLKSLWAQSGEACGLIVGTSTWCLVAILKSTLWHLSQNSEWHLNDILSLSNINSMLWIVFSVFWSFRVAPRSGTNAEWYQGPDPISISWISSPFSWNLHREGRTMLPNRLSHHPDELKLMIWRSGEINDWNQFLGVSWKGSTSTSKWRHPIQKSTLQWMKAETPVDCFQSSCLYDPFWRQFPRCHLCTSVYCDAIKSSTSHHVPTSLRRRRLVERRGLRVKEWRLVERRRRLRSWTRSWRRVNLLAMNQDCDALMQFAHFCPESLSACNANKVSCPVAL